MCQKEMRRIEFEEAIETENTKPISTSIDTNTMRKFFVVSIFFTTKKFFSQTDQRWLYHGWA